MSHLKHFKYNTVRKEKLLKSIDPAYLSKETNLFFLSIKGTLNHIYYGDLLWLMRITGTSQITSDQPIRASYEYSQLCKLWAPKKEYLFKDLFNETDKEYLCNHLLRVKEMDKFFIEHVSKFNEIQIQKEECIYKDTRGIDSKVSLEDALFHVINHTTHHIGQITAFLPKNEKYPELDYTYLI